ncbi:microcystin-dependent protein [Nonlabens dokdonensis]|jgi:microcystin-dependent protein|uniref:Phage Tail Collar n=2 Tax=Nonlabens dokdonensis TaxID=328515 RepID=L7W3B7_NONDD|nr:tail fiber protein [Nonlabens dokdonensis]AGC76015.1 phage Tail Collar [Nonlabens dokdonensis DSW-6]PZX43687.1 microcystin-dependent protein [Nonlabens dokdonensis]
MDPFIGQIVSFAGNFAPRGWAFCDGQLLAISQNTALFSILGTTYGGDGRSSFALPDLRGRTAIHPGTGPGLTNIKLGERGGAETHTLTISEMPSHTHMGSMKVSSAAADDDSPGSGSSIGASEIFVEGSANTALASGSVQTLATGGQQPFHLRNPFEGVNFIIAMQGIFPSRN